eukprot:3024951-Rhodomonas_salina.5
MRQLSRPQGKVCFFWSERGFCKFGRNCCFSHESKAAKPENTKDSRETGRANFTPTSTTSGNPKEKYGSERHYSQHMGWRLQQQKQPSDGVFSDAGAAVTGVLVDAVEMARTADDNKARDGPGLLSQLGLRHDNDSHRIRDVRVVPTQQEILCPRADFLPSNDLGAEHWLDQVGDTVDGTREEFVAETAATLTAEGKLAMKLIDTHF